jgi:hypothetical protein
MFIIHSILQAQKEKMIRELKEIKDGEYSTWYEGSNSLEEAYDRMMRRVIDPHFGQS